MLFFRMGVHAWMSPGPSLVIRYLHSGNGICDLTLTSENYTAGAMHMSAGKMSLQCPEHMYIVLCLLLLEVDSLAVSICKGKYLKLSYMIMLYLYVDKSVSKGPF